MTRNHYKAAAENTPVGGKIMIAEERITQVMVCTALVMGVLIGVLIGHLADVADFHADAIAHGCAHYDQQIGNWKWNK